MSCEETLAEIRELLGLDDDLEPDPDDKDELFGAEIVLTVGQLRRLSELLGMDE